MSLEKPYSSGFFNILKEVQRSLGLAISDLNDNGSADISTEFHTYRNEASLTFDIHSVSSVGACAILMNSLNSSYVIPRDAHNESAPDLANARLVTS